MKTSKRIIAIVAVVALVAILGVCLVACNFDSYKNKLEKKDYIVLDITKTANALKDTVEFALTASKGDDHVAVTKFLKADDAKEAYDKAAEGIKAAGKNPKDYLYRSGKLFISASSKQALKDAK